MTDRAERFLGAVRSKRKLLYGTCIAQARSIALDDGDITLDFATDHAVLAAKVNEEQALLSDVASKVYGRQMQVRATVNEPPGCEASPREAS